MKKFFSVDISALRRLKAVTKMNQPVLAQTAATAMLQLTQLEFRQEGRFLHGGWAPLSVSVAKAKTARKRKKNGKLGKARTGKPLLVDTGTLKKSFFVAGNGKGAVLGTPVKYAAHHQYGTKGIPARPFLPVTEQGQLIPKAVPYIERAVAARLKLLMPK